MNNDANKRLSVLEIFAFVGIYAVISVLRGTGSLPQNLSFIPVIETAWISAAIVIMIALWIKARGVALSDFGLRWPSSWKLVVSVAAAIIVVDTLVGGVARPILEQIYGVPEPINRFSQIPGNLPLILVLIPASWVIAGFAEEFFFRGFMMTAAAQLLGGGRAAWALALIVQAVAFGAVHIYQGPVNAIAIGIGGFVYGVGYLLARRNLWVVMLAHGANNTLGLVLVYAGVISV